MSDYIISLTSEEDRAFQLLHIDVYDFLSNVLKNKANDCVNELLNRVSSNNTYYLTDIQISDIQSKMVIINKRITNLKDLPIDIKHQIIRSMKPVPIDIIPIT